VKRGWTDTDWTKAKCAADEGGLMWCRIDAGGGERTITDSAHVAAGALAYYDDAAEIIRGGEFRTPFAIYRRDDVEQRKAAGGSSSPETIATEGEEERDEDPGDIHGCKNAEECVRRTGAYDEP
jgi:hypothetical protein